MDSASPVDLESLDASLRLANDSRLAIEAQLEMRKIAKQFASLLQVRIHPRR